jgi:hypothetical protein
MLYRHDGIPPALPRVDGSDAKMLKITTKTEEEGEVWELEGKLSGDWAGELKRCWRERNPLTRLRLRIHLKAVSYIDATGKLVLAEMYGEGVEIRGGGCMTHAVVEEIARQAADR